MNMQKLSVLVNYVIDQYIHILVLLAKTRKICEILSKKTGIGERVIQRDTGMVNERDTERKREKGVEKRLKKDIGR